MGGALGRAPPTQGLHLITALLQNHEGRLSRIRQLLTTANGYFETYSIRKRALPSAMMALLDAVQLHKEGQPLPEDLIVTTPEAVQDQLRGLKPGDPLPDEVQEVVQLAYWGLGAVSQIPMV
ncbi:hypothetical protein ccbrp13_17010 [Ktedonobacteria bacterium brp13]|nr:hypothetical protein ccbrp13_17010 [Ktedonobacteria bacterium brp13]